MTWTGPAFVDAHSHVLAYSAKEERHGHGLSLADYHRWLFNRGSTPMDESYGYDCADLQQMYMSALTRLRALGVAEVMEAGILNWDYYAALQELRTKDNLPIRVNIFLASGIARLDQMVPTGDSALALVGVKFYCDGWLGSRTCAVSQGFADDPQNHGILFMDSEMLYRRAQPFADAGWTIATHAIGDRAITTVLDAYTKLYGDDIRTAAPRIEHCQVTTPEIVARLAETGVRVCIQPSFAVSDYEEARIALGDRVRDAYDWAGMVRAGVNVMAGSDYPIETDSPLTGLQHLATGKGIGSTVDVAEPLRVDKTLELMTDPTAGTMSLTANPERISPHQLAEIAVVDCQPLL